MDYPIPDYTNSGRVCLILSIPDDDINLANFMGAMLTLANWRSYQRDDNQSGSKSASQWKPIVESIETQIGDCMNDYTVRLNPDDCLEVQQYDNALMDFADVYSMRCAVETVITEQFPPENPPAPGQPGPQTGGSTPVPGECWDLKFTVNTTAATLIPLAVAEDWIITPTDVKGSTTDGRFGPLNQWHCGDGGLYALGGCGGTTFLDSNDPDPTAPHQCLLLAFPDGTYAQVAVGVPITVPHGMAAGNYQLIINANTVSLPPAIEPWLASGELTVKLNICSPGGLFSHTFDWQIDMQGWVTDNPVYGYSQVASSGLVTNFSAASPGIVIKIPVSTPIIVTTYHYDYICSVLGTLYTQDAGNVFPTADAAWNNVLTLGTISRSGLSLTAVPASTYLSMAHIPGQSPYGQSTLIRLTITYRALYDPF